MVASGGVAVWYLYGGAALQEHNKRSQCKKVRQMTPMGRNESSLLTIFTFTDWRFLRREHNNCVWWTGWNIYWTIIAFYSMSQSLHHILTIGFLVLSEAEAQEAKPSPESRRDEKLWCHNFLVRLLRRCICSKETRHYKTTNISENVFVSVRVYVTSHSLSSRLRDDTLGFLIGSGSSEFDFHTGWTQKVTFTQNLTEFSQGKT